MRETNRRNMKTIEEQAKLIEMLRHRIPTCNEMSLN